MEDKPLGDFQQPTDFPPPPPKSSGGGALIWIILLLVGLMGVVSLCCCGSFLALPALNTAREAARITQSSNNLKQIGLAILNYEAMHGEFPPAYTVDENGQRLASWRTLILPYMEQAAMYDMVDFTKPWDDPANAHLGDIALQIYHSPRDAGTDMRYTNYVVITGDETIMPGEEATGVFHVRDGLSNTIMVLEVLNSDILWNEPRDLTMDDIRCVHHGDDPLATNVIPLQGVVLFADGAVRRMDDNVTREMLDMYLTRAGGEVPPEWPLRE